MVLDHLKTYLLTPLVGLSTIAVIFHLLRGLLNVASSSFLWPSVA